MNDPFQPQTMYQRIGEIIYEERRRYSPKHMIEYAAQFSLSELTNRLAACFAQHDENFNRLDFINACYGENNAE